MVMLSVGSIIGAGLFVGVGHTISLAGPSLLITFLLIGAAAVIVDFFLIEMSLSSPKSLQFHQYVGQALCPMAGAAVGWAYMMGMLVGPASELVAAGMLLQQWLGRGDLTRICIAVAAVAILISFLPQKLILKWGFFAAFLKIFVLLGFSLLGLAGIFGILPGLISCIGLQNYRGSGFFPHGLRGTMAAGIGVTMIYGGTESIGLFTEEKHGTAVHIPSVTYNIAFRMVFLYSFAAIILVGVLPWQSAKDAVSPFLQALEILGLGGSVVHIVTVVILLSITTLAVEDLFLVERLLFFLANDSRPFQDAYVSKTQTLPFNVRIATRIMLLLVLLAALQGDTPYLRLFYLSGVGFWFIWIMLTLAFPRYCRLAQRQHPDHIPRWHVPCPKLLQGVVLTILGLSAVCFSMTPLGQDTLLLSGGCLVLACFFHFAASKRRRG